MSCSAATASRMKSKLPACFLISSALRDSTTSWAPSRRASSRLPADVVKTTTWAAKDEPLVHYDAVRISAVSDRGGAVLVYGAIGQGSVGAELLQPFSTVRA